MNATLRLGLIGLSITLALNVFGLLVLRQPAARFLTNDWWSVWFPSFIVWFVIAIVGRARRSPGSREGRDMKHT
jgi:hypothetical protein